MMDKLRYLYGELEYWWENDAPKLVRVSIVTCVLVGWLSAVVLLGALDMLCGLLLFCVPFTACLAWAYLD